MVHPRLHNVLFIGMTAVNLLLTIFLAGIFYSPLLLASTSWNAVLGAIGGGSSSPSRAASSTTIFVEAAGTDSTNDDHVAKETLQSAFLQCLDTHYPQKREDFAYFLNCQGLANDAAEIGVQRGIHALQFLTKWEGRNLFLVDKWENVPADTYVDIANVPSMDDIKLAAQENLKEFKSRFTVLNYWSEDAAKQVDDNSLDFVYLDARHDFNGVSADLAAWWPKLRRGGIMAGHDYCDGELPEGDFFVESAVVNFFHDKMLPTQSIYTTKEPDRYVSFFLQKLTATASTSEDNEHSSSSGRAPASVVNYPYQEVYPKYSMYYRLYDGKRKALEGYPQGEVPGESEFDESCNLLCASDCDLRLDRVLELEMGYAVPENPNPVTRSSNTSGGDDQAAASPQKCDRREQGSSEDLGGQKCSTSSRTTAATEQEKFVSTSNGGGATNSTAPADTKKRQVEKKIAGYKRECLRRCGVTCGQRETLFDKIWKEVRESSSLLNGMLDEEDEDEFETPPKAAAAARNDPSDHPSTTISPVSTTATHYSSIVCPNRKNAFRWGVAFREKETPTANSSSDSTEATTPNGVDQNAKKSFSGSGVLPGVSASSIQAAPSYAHSSKIVWNRSMLESEGSCLKDYNADESLDDYYEYNRNRIGNAGGGHGAGGSLFTGQDELDSLSPFSEMLCYYGAKLLWGRWGGPCPFV